ncbi:MAG: TetR/AcrR family transcriptional regulator [Treponema sp.]|nr:TetR/AcrR family transcriptional regulator [Treponema sp.]MBR4386093.1 TetR/AcrR family transcriptional regulator [Treponema sp.]
MEKKLSRESIIMAMLNASFTYSAGAASLSDIAGALGVKKASLYNHFTGREDIVAKTTDFCADYMRALSFVPNNIRELVQKYPAAAVFKGIARSFFKMHTQEPLFQIYTFVHSQKFFCAKSAAVAKECSQRLCSQVVHILELLGEAEKIALVSKNEVMDLAKRYSSVLQDLLCDYLVERKILVMQNPASGEGELFALPENSLVLKDLDQMTVSFFANVG